MGLGPRALKGMIVSTDPKCRTAPTVLAALGIVSLPVLCCGVPLLIGIGAAGALGAIGSVLGNPWVISAAVVLVAGVLMLALRGRRTAGSQPKDDCCAPPSPAPVHTPADHAKEDAA